MKIVAMMVSSVNGKITHGDDPVIYKWTSDEDSRLFFSQIQENNLIVMGSKTYEVARDMIVSEPNKLRIILTHNPKKYSKEANPGIVEFTDEDPKSLVARLEKAGYKQMLLVGGGETNLSFLQAKLINELNLTIEPFIFSSGKPLVGDSKLNVDLHLTSIKRLNDRGTLFLKYQVTYKK